MMLYLARHLSVMGFESQLELASRLSRNLVIFDVRVNVGSCYLKV